MHINCLLSLFNSDPLAKIMSMLIFLVGISVLVFAKNYMKGIKNYKLFFIKIIVLMMLVTTFVNADNLILFWVAWLFANVLLVNLMIHNPNWQAAKYSGILALKDFALGAIFLGCAFLIIYFNSGTLSIKIINSGSEQLAYLHYSLVLILIAAMTQSSIWPLHRWLLSSLNSPTPVSALMHAGLLNGGGFVLIRFAPLYLQSELLLNIIFIAGLVSAVLGTLWKLMQNDVKRMLACSTMGQMGFTFMQCGLGLFPAAVTHLVYHGMFKAYLFLNSSSAAQEKRYDLSCEINIKKLLVALCLGFIGSIAFGYAADKSWLILNTNIVLMVVAFISTSQVALHLISSKNPVSLVVACAVSIIFGAFYGWTVNIIAMQMSSMNILKPQSMGLIHWLSIVILGMPWCLALLCRLQSKTFDLHPLLTAMYVSCLNSSQPHPKTITAARNQYTYK